MYKTTTPEIFRKYLELPGDYAVDGFLASGVWDLYTDKHLSLLKQALEKLGVAADIKRLEHSDLGHAYEFRTEGKVYWFAPVMGTAVMSTYAHMASAFGSKKNILVGTVGGLAPGVKAADFIIPTASQGNQNAYMYDREAKNMMFYPDSGLAHSLMKRLPSTCAVAEGPTTTCEVLLAETWEDIQSWSNQGFLGVEMEAALIFALSKSFGIPAAALLFVADNLIEETTIFDDGHALSKNLREISRVVQYEAALAELLGL